MIQPLILRPSAHNPTMMNRKRQCICHMHSQDLTFIANDIKMKTLIIVCNHLSQCNSTISIRKMIRFPEGKEIRNISLCEEKKIKIRFHIRLLMAGAVRCYAVYAFIP